MTQAVCEYVLGMGGWALDPVDGAALLLRKIAGLGLAVPPAYDPSNIQGTIDAIKALPPDVPLIGGGDSCGGNRWAIIADAIKPRKVKYLFVIQASLYCNAGCPPIGDNVEEVFCVYASKWKTGGLGAFKPPLAVPPVVPDGVNLYDGVRRLGNKGQTLIRYTYVNDLHPGDFDVPGVQAPVLADIRRILGMK